MINTVFFGSSDKSLPVLHALHKHFNLALMVTRPDKPVGRTQTITSSAPKTFARNHHIPVITPPTFADQKAKTEAADQIAATHPTIAVVADYGRIIPKEIFMLPAFGTLNIHLSKLPQYRGASPVQHAILNADPHTAVTFFVLEETLDTGPIVFQKNVPLAGAETAPELYTVLFAQAADEIIRVIPEYIEGTLTPKPQPKEDTSIAPRITRTDGYVPWKLFAAAVRGEKVLRDDLDSLPALGHLNVQRIDSITTLITRMHRAFTPWPGIYTEITLNGKPRRLKILDVQLAADNLQLKRVQFAGKQPVSWQQLQQGYPYIKADLKNPVA